MRFIGLFVGVMGTVGCTGTEEDDGGSFDEAGLLIACGVAVGRARSGLRRGDDVDNDFCDNK